MPIPSPDRSRVPRLMAISQRSLLGPGGLEAWLGDVAESGVEAVQIREKDLSDRELFSASVTAAKFLQPTAKVIVNGRADVAMAAGADGVHLAAHGLPVAAARRLLGARRLVGVSAHSLAEVEKARDAGADYVFFSPIWATPDKGEPVGVEALRRVASLGVPVIALGGITIGRFPAVAAAGAVGVAGIRMFRNPEGWPQMAKAAEECFER